MTFFPYMFFSCQTPQACWTFVSSSQSSGKGRPYFSLNLACAAGPSFETPRMAVFLFANFSTSSRKSETSWLQPEVLAFG
jgi:hypothetical protein